MKVRECTFHLKCTVQALKGAVQHSVGGAGFIKEFVRFLFSPMPEQDLLDAWVQLQANHPEVTQERLPLVYRFASPPPPPLSHTEAGLT